VQVVTDGPIKIDTTASRTAKRSQSRWTWWFIGLIAAICAINLAVFTWRLVKQTEKAVTTAHFVAKAGERMSATQKERADESELQWVSPTSGPPISLEYVPLGTQVILHLRPAELTAHGEGEKILAALGPWGERKVAQMESELGVQLAEIESLLIAIYRDGDHMDVAIIATRNEPWSKSEVQDLLDVMPAIDRTLLLPPSGQGRVLISCSGSAALEIEKRSSKTALLSRDLERLLPLTDQHRSSTLLMPTKFLDTAGRELLLNGGEKLIAGFDAVIPDNASAVAISLDWRDHFFCELAATIVQNAPAHRFNAKFAEQLKSAEHELAASLETNPPHPYGKAIEERFPAMLRSMSEFTRVSHAKGIALARCYLPVEAGHNLLFASRLRLSERSPAPRIPEASLSVAERLRQVTTLSFPKETLENALEMLAVDAKLTIQIAGRDLQLEGITKNQTFAIDLRNRPVAEILVEVLRRANPDREATGPGDPRQKLVYVIREDAVIVTTRSAATQRGEELPEVFRVPLP
jgi:hypothetical protein